MISLIQTKTALLSVISLSLVLFFYFGLNQYLDLEFFVQKKRELDSLYRDSPILFVLAFFVFYVFCAAFSIPGSALLTLAAGWLFHFFVGAAVVSLGSATGAVVAFLISRLFLKNFVQRRFHSHLKAINRGFKKDGAFYLFSLRLIPIFPFFAVNLFMGVTPISVKQFFIASFLGMLPGSLVFVNAGRRLADIKSLTEIFSPVIILSFILLASLPWIMKFLLKAFPLKPADPA